MLGLSLVVFNVESDRLLNLVCAGALNEIVNETLVGFSLEDGHIVNESDDLLELAGGLINAVLRMLNCLILL